MRAAPAPEPQAQAAPPPQAKSSPPSGSKAQGPKPKPAKSQGTPTKSQGNASKPPAHSNRGTTRSSVGSTKSSGAKTRTASGPRQSQNAGTGDNPQGRGPAGKTQYCHATHSETNPFVLITTNNNALWAHRQHQDEEDIIPATNGQCGTTSQRTVDDPTDGGPGPDDGGPGPGGDDGPGANGIDGADTPADGRDPAESDVLGENESSPRQSSPVDDAGPGGDGAAPAVTEEAAGEADDGSLPFTGLGLAAILAMALVMLGSGMTVRRFTDGKDA